MAHASAQALKNKVGAASKQLDSSRATFREMLSQERIAAVLKRYALTVRKLISCPFITLCASLSQGDRPRRLWSTRVMRS